MTIAACYVSSEGVVLGADSTASYAVSPASMQHYNNAQKIFEIGEKGSSLGIVTWGRAGFPQLSYRQLVADLSDELLENRPANVEDCAIRWCDLFWRRYSHFFAADLQIYSALKSKPNRTPQEESQLHQRDQSMSVGFCIGGHVQADRTPAAYLCSFHPSLTAKPIPTAIKRNMPVFWGVPNIMERLLWGIDKRIYNAIMQSGSWGAGQAALDNMIKPHVLSLPLELPLREAIDWIFSSIFVTIKAMKFSMTPPVCGGPIEVAVVSADRQFRWVCHKGLDQALWDHSARGSY